MNIEKIKKELKQLDVIYFERITSTNDVAKEGGFKKPTLILAGEQTRGRGRMGRSWESHAGKGIYFTYVFMEVKRIESAGVISLLAAVAVARMLKEWGIPSSIKWPNDVLIEGKKIGGILCEGVVSEGVLKQVAIGIGINVNFNREDLPEDLRRRPTSMKLELQGEVERELVVVALARELERVLEKFKQGDWREEIAYLDDHSYLKGKKISLESGLQGEYLGIDKEGRLLVKTEGKIIALSSGEIQVLEG